MTHDVPNLSNRPWMRNRNVKKLFSTFRAAGAEARIVGGAVRNALLSRPVDEIDMAINMPPQKVMEVAGKAGFEVIPSGIDHGTVTIILGKDPPRPVEVTTLRKDIASHGRKADVSFTDDWAEDASRRDFTLNALYCDEEGEIFDPLGGLPDVFDEKVIFIGQARERVREDYLRILRFFRFSAEYGRGEIDTAGLCACKELRSGLDTLSRERIGKEFLKLLKGRHAATILEEMAAADIYRYVLPGIFELGLFRGVVTFEALFCLAPNPVRRLSALGFPAFLDGSLAAEELREKLCLSTRQKKQILNIWQFAAELRAPLGGEAFDKCLYLWGEEVRLDVLSLAYALDKEKDKILWQDLLSRAQTFRMPHFPISGDDLIRCGFEPGPGLGVALKRLEDQWIDSHFTLSRDDLLKGIT